MENDGAEEIVLPNGQRVPARPWRYRVTPPPNLRDIELGLFIFEYDCPELIVRDAALSTLYTVEQGQAQLQIYKWQQEYGDAGGVSLSRCGYAFNSSLDSGASGFHQQFVSDFAFIASPTWSGLSVDEKNMAYLPCLPTVVLQFTTNVDSMEGLQTKVTKFVDTGTREGVVVDISGQRGWIYNRGEEPRFEPLAAIEFDSRPGFTLDCSAILEEREQERRRLGM
ncbi:Uma2 family endonuclease [Phytophthora cinnamomi]|uniref:Uma2 family endonuclease n=1 Tax=Phytophthora cinnamomi TaxID=4785 RepID=UPI003559B20A|nr:Uma2 family endonuclease [Phytophthora cinnamomi]